MTNELKCIPATHRNGDRCDNPAEWYVWYDGCIGIYTYHCNWHLAESLLDKSVKVVQIDSIERVRENNERYMKDIAAITARRAS